MTVVSAAQYQSGEMGQSVRSRQPKFRSPIVSKAQVLKSRQLLQGRAPESSQVGIAIVCVRTERLSPAADQTCEQRLAGVPRINRQLLACTAAA